jgi:flap endonuclease-1
LYLIIAFPQIENYTGRKIAIDASMAMYQFLVAVRSQGPGGGGQTAQLMNEAGEVTSHIQGMFNRTIKMMTSGVRPVYIFDGKPPQMKGGELAKRLAKRAKAEVDLAAAKAAEDVDDINKFNSRLVKVTRQHNEDCKELLRLMGVPVVNAPCEAEAQCAELARNGKVYATATEDMDALTFKTPKLVRKMTFSQAKGKDKQPIIEIDHALVLRGLDLTYEQFVDMCILCGCDYCGSIKGIGPKNALKLVRAHKTIEAIIAHLQKEKTEKNEIPDDWFERRIPILPEQTQEEKDAEEAEEAAEEAAADAAEAAAEAARQSSSSSSSSEMKVEGEEVSGEKADAGVEDVKTEEEKEKTEESVKTEDVKEEKEGVKTEEGFKTEDADVQEDAVQEASMKLASEEVEEVIEAKEVKEDEERTDVEYEIVPPIYLQARKLFLQCDVTPADEVELKWEAPDEAGLTSFLVDKMQFSAERVAGGIKRLKEAMEQKSQKRMDSFFTAMPSAGTKRKVEEVKKGAKKGKGAGGAKKR